MSNQIEPDHVHVQKGPHLRAKIDFYQCDASGECIKVCPEQAIEEGPKRLPAAVCISEGKYELLPGKAVVIEDKCTGCGDCVSVCPSHAIVMVSVSQA